MEPLDVDGLFWLVDKPDDKVAGRLRFNPTQGSRLDLIGKFKDFVPSGRNPPVRMNAIAGGRSFTLENCHFAGLKVEYLGEGQQGLTRHWYQSDLLLAGLHWEGHEPLRFKNILLHLRYLEEWLNQLSSFPRGYDGRSKNPPLIVAAFDELKRQAVVSGAFGELGLAYGRSTSGDRFLETMIQQNFFLDLRLADAASLDRVMSLCGLLQDMVTLGCDSPSALTDLAMEHPQQGADTSPTRKVPIKPYVRSIGNYAPGPPEGDSHSRKLFTFDDIGGIQGIAKWLAMASRYRIAIGALVGNLYAPGPYLESKFFNACTAAEAFRRIQLRRQNLNLAKELIVLAQQAGDTFKELVGDVGKWAKQVVRTRDNIVVHRGLRRGANSYDVIWLADSLHLLVVLCLLGECGVQQMAEGQVRQSERFYLLKQGW